MAGIQGVFQTDWYNENSQRNYPLMDGMDRKDTLDQFTIPNDLFVDFQMTIPAELAVNLDKFHIARITILGTGLVVALGYDSAEIAQFAIDSRAFTYGKAVSVDCTGAFIDCTAVLVFGNLDNVFKSAGTFVFTPEHAQLSPTTLRPDIRCVSALYIRNGNEIQGPFQGDMILQAGRNIELTYEPSPDGSAPNKIIVSAISGLNLNDTCDCTGVLAQAKPSIKTINGIPPDADGNFSFLGDECLTVAAETAALKLSNSCSKPCCGCDELNVLLSTLKTLTDKIRELEVAAAELRSNIGVATTNLLASKTGSVE